MKVFFKIFLISISFLVMFVFSLQNVVRAAPEFQHLISANYIIREDNSATVEYHFKTTNKLNNNYLKSYSFTVPFEPLNIKTDKSVSPTKLKKLNKISDLNTYEMEIEFLNPTYGSEKAFDWSFSFDIKDIVIDRGMQKAIIIPTFVKDDSFITYNISLKLPKKLGELSNIYGNAGIQENESDYFLSFVSTRNPAPNIIVLLNNTQEYSFEVNDIKSETIIPLPLINEKQKVIYSDFPEKEVNINHPKDINNYITLQENQSIKGIIKTTKGYEKEIGVIESKFPDYKYLNEITDNINSTGLSQMEIARKIYEDYLFRFTIGDYRINKDTALSVEEDKFNVNPVELNYIYRYLLNRFNIQSRGVYGYVYPIQPFRIENPKTDIHVWTEIWDGEKWISVDPVWYLSSRGTIYFDNNDFHHISFGNYYDIEKLKTFLKAGRNITVRPLKSREYIEKNSNLNIEVVDKVYMNREVRAKVVNNSNYPISLKDIKLNLDSPRIKVTNQFDQLNVVLYPNTTANLTFPLDYDLVLLSTHEDVRMDVRFFEKNENKTQTVNSSIIIQTNISSYISMIIFCVFIIFGLISVFSISIYKKRSKI